MFDLGWTELLLVGIVALIVVGPKDLPQMFRALGRFTAKIRGMAREFQRAMEDAADDSGVKDVSKDLRNITNPKKMGLDAMKDAVGDLGKWTPEAKPAAMSSDAAKRSAAEAETARKSSGAQATSAKPVRPDAADVDPGIVADNGAPAKPVPDADGGTA